MFRFAIVRTPSPNIRDGITTASLGKPVYEDALQQHAGYISALQACGVEVIVLPADPAYPDACFVEDTAVLAERVAVITNPGAPSRKGEELKVAAALRAHYPDDRIERITSPGTLEGGDVMRVGNQFYIGLSERTNKEGARQLIGSLASHGYTGSTVRLSEVLHLKSGLAYLENDLLLTAGEFIHHPEFEKFNRILIDPKDAYSANCITINGTVLVPAGYPDTRKKIEAAGCATREVEVSEFRKIDGGLSCLSLRF
jgi:dimethylargininase